MGKSSKQLGQLMPLSIEKCTRLTGGKKPSRHERKACRLKVSTCRSPKTRHQILRVEQ